MTELLAELLCCLPLWMRGFVTRYTTRRLFRSASAMLSFFEWQVAIAETWTTLGSELHHAADKADLKKAARGKQLHLHSRKRSNENTSPRTSRTEVWTYGTAPPSQKSCWPASKPCTRSAVTFLFVTLWHPSAPWRWRTRPDHLFFAIVPARAAVVS